MVRWRVGVVGRRGFRRAGSSAWRGTRTAACTGSPGDGSDCGARGATAGGPCGMVHAHAATGDERVRLWGRWRESDAHLDDYAARRPAETAVVVLEPQAAGHARSTGSP